MSRINFDTDIGHYFYWYFSCMEHIMINVLTLGKLLSVYGLAKNIKDKRTWNKTFIEFGCCLCFGVWKIIWKYLPLRYTPIGSFHVFSLCHWVCVCVCVSQLFNRWILPEGEQRLQIPLRNNPIHNVLF